MTSPTITVSPGFDFTRAWADHFLWKDRIRRSEVPEDLRKLRATADRAARFTAYLEAAL